MDEGRIEEGLEQSELEPDEFWRLWAQAILFTSVGKHDDAERSLGVIREKFEDGNAYQIAEIYAASGAISDAFDWLDRAFKQRDPGVTHARVNPRFKPLHEDTRWADLLLKIGLDQ